VERKEESERRRLLKKESRDLNFIKKLENIGGFLHRSEGIKRKEEEMGLLSLRSKGGH